MTIDFGNLIRSYRVQAKLSQSDLAQILQISSQLLYKYENNLSKPSIDRFLEICFVLNIQVDSIVEDMFCKDNNLENQNSKNENRGKNKIRAEKYVYDVNSDSNLKLLIDLRKKFSKIKCSKIQTQLFLLNKKLINRSLSELELMNNMLK